MRTDLRRWMTLVETKEPRHGIDGEVPNELFHGTSLENFLEIRATDALEENSEGSESLGFSTTEKETVAIRFARMKSYGQKWGVVLTLNGEALAQDFRVEPYNDDDEYSPLGEYEFEWVVLSKTGVIKPASRYITRVQVIDMNGDPNWLQPWDEAVHGLREPDSAQNDSDAVAALRRAYTEQQARSALLGLAQKVHPEQSGRKLRGLIADLETDDV